MQSNSNFWNKFGQNIGRFLDHRFLWLRYCHGGGAELANLLKTESKHQLKPESVVIFNENFTLFQSFFKFYRIFRQNLGKNWENSRNIHFVGVRAADSPPPESSEFTKILFEKSMENCNFKKVFINYEGILTWKS